MTNLKGLFAGKPAFTQFVILVLLVLSGMFLFTLLSTGILFITKGPGVEITACPDLLRLIQFLSSVGSFLLPALGMAWLCSKKPQDYLSIGKVPGGTILLYLLLVYFLLSPTLNLMQYINLQMTLPEFMRPIEDWMREQEDSAEKLTSALLSDNSPLTLLANLFVIAVTASIAEEFFFRGTVQRILERRTANPHLVIWITAIIFSAIHLQFYGFIPRMLIGAYLGYLLLWSRNIWVPVFAHFINNGIAVIGLSNSKLKNMEYFNGELNPEHFIPYTIAAIVSFLFLIPVLQRLRKEFKKQML